MNVRLLALAVPVLAGALLAAQETQRFRSRSDLVIVDVLVMDDRRPVPGLTARDFELLDNGVPRAIEQLYLERLPVNVILVLDTSGSVQGERLGALRAGARSVIDRLRPEDRAAVIAFSHRLDLAAALTGDRAALHDAIARLDAAGGTALRDAAFAGLALRGADARRTLLLVFSDGVDTISLLDEQSVMDVARRSDAILYAVGIRDQATLARRGGRSFLQPGGTTDDRFLTRLSRETGGRLFYAEQNREIEQTFARVLEEFNSRYVLAFAAPADAGRGWRPIEVRLKNRPGTVVARRGYFVD